MSLLNDLRLNIGDESLPTGASISGANLLTDLRLDYGDDATLTGVSISGGNIVSDLRVDYGDDSPLGFYSGTVASGLCSPLDELRVDYADDPDSNGLPAIGGGTPPLPPGFIPCPPGTQTPGSVAIWNGNCSLTDSQVIIDSSGNITTPGGAEFGGDVCLGGALSLNKRIVTASGPIQMLDSDGILFINKSISESTLVTLPLNPKCIGMMVIVKDMKGDADTNFITVQMSGGTLDGLSQFIMSNNYQSMTFAFNGNEWNII